MHAFILAGGFATRLGPITERRAKPLLPLAGQPLISHLIDRIPKNIPITVSTNEAFGEDFEQWNKNQNRDGIKIVVEKTANDDQKLGALGAVAQWIKQEDIQDDLLLLTGDNYIGFSVKDFLSHATPGVSLLATHDIGSKEQAKAFGTVILKEDGKRIAAFEEKPKEPKSTLVSTGCSLLSSEILPVLLEYAHEHPDNVGGIFEELLQRNIPIECYHFEEPWFDIGSFDAYLEATNKLVGDNLLIEPSSEIKNTDHNGAIVIGAKSTVAGSSLRNVVIFNECKIEDCVLENCVIDNNCTLKGVDLNKKMIREGTNLNQKL